MKMMKINFTNIMAYIQGNIRYKLYYSRFKFLIRIHIREQIDFRIRFMDKECYENGMCKLCGCSTTALQMANKQCDKPCYPPIVNANDWLFFKRGYAYIRKNLSAWLYTPPLVNGIKKGKGESLLYYRDLANSNKTPKKIWYYPQNNLA